MRGFFMPRTFETEVTVPSNIAQDYTYWVIGTSAGRKYDGMADTFSDGTRTLLQMNPEERQAFVEPDMNDEECVAWYKAMVLLYQLNYISLDKLVEFNIPYNNENHFERTGIISAEQEALVMSMDVSTKVAKNRQDLNAPAEEHRAVEFLKLSRQVTDETSQEEVSRIIKEDKEKYKALFKSELHVRFRVGVAVVSSDEKHNKTAMLEFDVETTGFPDSLIDEEYANPMVIFIGPRLNLAQIISDHPELIKKVTVRQPVMKDEFTESQKGKGRRKKKVLPRYKWPMVTKAVVEGVLPVGMYEALFEEQNPPATLVRTRSNIEVV